jgi:phenylacetate-coenzyme A ligase PaaK-like adenylate-forming protein
MDPWGPIAKLSKSETIALQNRKLSQFLQNYLYPFSPYYQNLFNQHGIKPQSIRTIQDLKHIPFTSKRDFVDANKDPSQRVKDFILQPSKEKIKKAWPASKLLSMAVQGMIQGKESVQDTLGWEFRPVFTTFTTGTTNKPVPFFYSNYDMENLRISGGRMLRLFDIEPSEHIVNLFPFAPHLAFWQVVSGGLSASTLIFSTGGGKVMGTEGNIVAIERMKPSVILGVPSYVYHVLREAKEKGCRMEYVKKIVLGAAKVTIPFKMKLAELLSAMGANNVSIFGTYGFTEARAAWAECPTTLDVSSGYHLYSDKEIFEVVDPQTGEVKKEGEDGELVYTSIDSRTSVMLRYRTGDFVKGGITYEPCPHCKRTVPRISSDISRLSNVKDLQLSKIKGSLVNLDTMACVFNDIKDVVEWQVELKKHNDDPYDVDQVIVYVCPQEGKSTTNIEESVRNQMLLQTEVLPNEVRFVPLKELVKRLELETATKEKRILDNRPKI